MKKRKLVKIAAPIAIQGIVSATLSMVDNIMVGFLILMNLFMLVIIAVTTMQQSYIPERVINAAIKVIRQSGFEISDDIFPKTYYTLPSYRAQFYSASDLSDLFFGQAGWENPHSGKEWGLLA